MPDDPGCAAPPPASDASSDAGGGWRKRNVRDLRSKFLSGFQQADLGELRFSQEERDKHVELDILARSRKQELSVSRMVPLLDADCKPSVKYEDHFQICEDSRDPDIFLMAKKRPRADVEVRKNYTTFQLMRFYSPVLQVWHAPAPWGVPEISTKPGQRVTDFRQDVDSDHGGSEDLDDDASTANAIEVTKGVEAAKGVQADKTHKALDVQTVVSSHTSLRSSTRLTPSKVRRNLKRAEEHHKKMNDQKKGAPAEKEDPKVAEEEVQKKGAPTEKEGPKVAEEDQKSVKETDVGASSDEEETDNEGCPSEDDKTTQGGPSSSASIGHRVLAEMDQIPPHKRVEFLEGLAMYIRNFVAPPSAPAPQPPPAPLPPPPSDGSSDVWRREAAVAVPQPPPPAGAKGLGRWIAGQWCPRNPVPDSIEASILQINARLGFYQFQSCPLCSKLLDFAHENSMGHRQKVHELAQVTMILGETLHVKEWSPVVQRAFYPSAAVPLTAAAFKAHWGTGFPGSMVEAAKKVLETKGVILFGRTPTRLSNVVKLEGGIVEYSSQGKYVLDGPESSITPFYPWDVLEARDPAGEQKQQDGQHWERLIDPKDEIKLMDKRRGYWPVVRIQTDQCARPVPRLRTRCYIVCVMQLLWPEPRGWEVWRAATSHSRL